MRGRSASSSVGAGVHVLARHPGLRRRAGANQVAIAEHVVDAADRGPELVLVQAADRESRLFAAVAVRPCAGQVGRTAAYHLSREQANDVTVVDTDDEILRDLQDRLDIRTVAGRLRLQNARDQMLKVAADYERMARDAKQREITQGLSRLSALVVRQRHGRQAA